MRRWFSSQPIHRKLVLTSLAKTTVVLGTAMLLLAGIDAWRFRASAVDDVRGTARLIGESVRAMVEFEQYHQLAEHLTLMRVRPQLLRACVFDSDSRLIGSYVRAAASPCPDRPPATLAGSPLAALEPVVNSGQQIGWVLVERDWAWLQRGIVMAALTTLFVLLIASALMVAVSHRLHGRISQPISQLAAAARRVGESEDYSLPAIQAPPDEVGDLVRAFGAMVDRVRTAREDLTKANDALRREIEERRLVEAERERLLQRELEAGRVKDEFLATVSHELRTPLNAIVGWARILSTTSADPATVARAAASLHRNAQIQARVIDDLIDISRIVTGKLKVLSEPLDLRQVVDSAVEAIRPTAEQARIALTVELPPDACTVHGDSDRLQQIVWNLLSNAVKFAPGGHVRVSVSQRDDTLSLTVSDDGIGIAPEFLGHVFDRFRQADSSITREHGGLGIGLAVVKELVELHRGEIRVESEGRGRGATFRVTLPCYAGDVPETVAEDRTPSLAGVSVLIVDDNPDALDLLETTLRRVGAIVRVAPNGGRALELWAEQPADVLLCDLAMPGMSGFDVLAGIRELDRAGGRVTPAIAVTAHATEDHIARSARAGFQMHVTKPFDPNRLIRAVATVRARV
jgi:signal transduction histidine kinase/ActR/RegA family two-component response regulator